MILDEKEAANRNAAIKAKAGAGNGNKTQFQNNSNGKNSNRTTKKDGLNLSGLSKFMH